MTYIKLFKVKAELITCLSAHVKISLKALQKQLLRNTFTVYSFIFFMNVHQVEARVSDPGGDDSSSGGGSDLGAAQNSLEVWTFT